MAIVLINSVTTRSKGGFEVTIDGIEPTDHDCFVGQIVAPALGTKDARWNLSGLLRDGDESGNLNLTDADVRDLIATAKKLGAE